MKIHAQNALNHSLPLVKMVNATVQEVSTPSIMWLQENVNVKIQTYTGGQQRAVSRAKKLYLIAMGVQSQPNLLIFNWRTVS